MEKIRFGCHSFLNAKPIINYLLQKKEYKDKIDLFLGSPSEISDKLLAAELDIGFIPSIEFLKNDNLYLLPDFSISAYGKVMSVLLISEKEIKDIENILLDTRSRTSIVLLNIILKKKYGITPSFITPLEGGEKKRYDARLLIGDEALEFTYEKKGKEAGKIIDLAEEWHEITGLPFVFAVIASRKKEVPKQFLKILKESRDRGIKNIEEIAEGEYKTCNIKKEALIDYLKNRIDYFLTDKEIEGLKAFQEISFKKGLIETKYDFTFATAI
ncbi:MAG: hypothetical protein D6734_03290 [Candidatus Schekmanbacteria bacterium]|nr:MAG: hypothetical protein D6734_03290 [Candidatus Schekmanbacteria bacterium]